MTLPTEMAFIAFQAEINTMAVQNEIGALNHEITFQDKTQMALLGEHKRILQANQSLRAETVFWAERVLQGEANIYLQGEVDLQCGIVIQGQSNANLQDEVDLQGAMVLKVNLKSQTKTLQGQTETLQGQTKIVLQGWAELLQG